MGNWRAGYIERCPSGSGRRETVSVHDSTVKLTPWSLKSPLVRALWRKPAGSWRLRRTGRKICRCGQMERTIWPSTEKRKAFVPVLSIHPACCFRRKERICPGGASHASSSSPARQPVLSNRMKEEDATMPPRPCMRSRTGKQRRAKEWQHPIWLQKNTEGIENEL